MCVGVPDTKLLSLQGGLGWWQVGWAQTETRLEVFTIKDGNLNEGTNPTCSVG